MLEKKIQSKNVLIVFIAFFVCLIFITGCDGAKSNQSNQSNNDSNQSKTGILNCSKVETDEDGYKTTDDVEVTYENNIINKIKTTTITEMDKDLVDSYLEFNIPFTQAFNEIDGYTMNYTKEDDNAVKLVMELDYKLLNIEQVKEVYGEDFDENAFYAVKNYPLDEYIKEDLDGYTCK